MAALVLFGAMRAVSLAGEISGNTAKEKATEALYEKYAEASKLTKERRFQKAEKLCREIISRNPSDHVTYSQLGEIYWAQEKRKAAIKMFRKAIKINPDYPVPRFSLGKAYFFDRKIDKSVAEFNVFQKKMDKLFPKSDALVKFYIKKLHYICYMYSTLKRYDDAMRVCRKIIKLKSDDAKAHYNLAVCYYVYKHNRSAAYGELKKVMEMTPETRIGDMAKFYVDYMRRNADARILGDFSFLKEE